MRATAIAAWLFLTNAHHRSRNASAFEIWQPDLRKADGRRGESRMCGFEVADDSRPAAAAMKFKSPAFEFHGDAPRPAAPYTRVGQREAPGP